MLKRSDQHESLQWRSWRGAVFGLAMAMLCGCKPYRVEYHKRPGFYEKAALGKLPDEVTLDDGTIIKYQTTEAQSTLGRTGDDKHKPFEIRQQKDDGKIELRAILPEHVLANTLTCLSNEEYELLYNQMLSERTRQEYAQAGQQGLPEFTEFFQKNRHDLAATLTRMVAGLPHEEVSMTSLGDGVTRCTLRPQIAEPFKFKSVYVVKEGQGMKLLMIR